VGEVSSVAWMGFAVAWKAGVYREDAKGGKGEMVWGEACRRRWGRGMAVAWKALGPRRHTKGATAAVGDWVDRRR